MKRFLIVASDPKRGIGVLLTVVLLSLGLSSHAGDNEYRVRAFLPAAVHSNLVARFREITCRVYPVTDRAWLDGVLATKFPNGECDFQMYMTGCELGDWFHAKSGLKTGWNLASGLEMVGSEAPIRGEPEVADRAKPLTIDEGKPMAEAVFNRLKDLMTLGKEMQLVGQTAPDPKLPYSEDRAVWIYTWSASDRMGFGSTVAITMRARDGRVVAVRMKPSPSEGVRDLKLTREQALEKAKALPGPIDEKYLSLSVRHWYAERRLVWQYTPPPPEMFDKYNYGIWDAMTGELLESDCLNGAKPQYKVYYNPEFFFEPTEANVKANLEKNLKKWAEELEAKEKAAKAPEAKPPEGK